MGKTKRMIYIREENQEFYDGIENKSDFVNECLKTARLGGVDNIKTTEVSEGPLEEPEKVADVSTASESMRERDLRRLKEYRAKQGFYDPTKV